MTAYSGMIDEDALNATQAAYDPLFRMHRPTGAPPPMERESETAYRTQIGGGSSTARAQLQRFQYTPFYWLSF